MVFALAAGALLCAGCSLQDAAEGEASAATSSSNAPESGNQNERAEAQPKPVSQAKSPRKIATRAAVNAAETVDPLAGLKESSRHLAGIGTALFGARWRLSVNGLPKNSRQVGEGYWIGAHPTPEHIQELHARGVKVILSGTYLNRETRELFEELGMQHIDVPFGGTFPSSAAILEGVKEATPDEVYIHCEHGGDRSGAMLAFLLSVRHDWAPDHALLAVAFPGAGDLRRLIEALDSQGVEVTSQEEEEYAGIYSAERNGGFGGLKVRGPSYQKLVRTTVEAMEENGVPIN